MASKKCYRCGEPLLAAAHTDADRRILDACVALRITQTSAGYVCDDGLEGIDAIIQAILDSRKDSQ